MHLSTTASRWSSKRHLSLTATAQVTSHRQHFGVTSGGSFDSHRKSSIISCSTAGRRICNVEIEIGDAAREKTGTIFLLEFQCANSVWFGDCLALAFENMTQHVGGRDTFGSSHAAEIC